MRGDPFIEKIERTPGYGPKHAKTVPRRHPRPAPGVPPMPPPHTETRPIGRVRGYRAVLKAPANALRRIWRGVRAVRRRGKTKARVQLHTRRRPAHGRVEAARPAPGGPLTITLLPRTLPPLPAPPLISRPRVCAGRHVINWHAPELYTPHVATVPNYWPTLIGIAA